MNELALFAGIGGGILGGKLCGFRTVCAVEINEYCRGVLLQRQKEGLLPFFPIWDDVQTFDGRPWSKVVDIITGGFPCQPFSLAGKRKGEADERNLWGDTIRIIREVRPPFLLLENVPGLLSSGFFSTIITDISEAGYLCRWQIISAAEVGAPHIRKRLWITGVLSDPGRKHGESGDEKFGILSGVSKNREACNITERSLQILPDTKSVGLEERLLPVRTPEAYAGLADRDIKKGIREEPKPDWWAVEPGLDRLANGICNRLDRLKAIGNAQVPRVAAEAWFRFIGGG